MANSNKPLNAIKTNEDSNKGGWGKGLMTAAAVAIPLMFLHQNNMMMEESERMFQQQLHTNTFYM